MKIKLTNYGLPQVVVLPVIILTVMVVYLIVAPGFFAKTDDLSPADAIKVIWIPEFILLILLIWILAFFRDPQRFPPTDTDVLLAPADGMVSDIDIVDEPSVIGGKALRIGIFLNIFNVHINRVPCAVEVDKITYKRGQFKNALNPDSSRINESNDIEMRRLDDPADKLLIRQISGTIARRIVCKAQKGQNFAGGQKFGMIKFGSRTELYLPARGNVRCLVKTGDKVKAGLTILVRYEKCQTQTKTMLEKENF